MTSNEPLAPRPDAARPGPIPRIVSQRLMDGKREIIIEHGPEEYRLRVTASGKLILTK